jgi:hypothetical protein
VQALLVFTAEMVQKGYVLSGILLLGLFMFISTLWTLENYNLQEQQRQSSNIKTYFTNSFYSPFLSNSSSPSSASPQANYFSLPSFENETLWNFELNSFEHLFENASLPFGNLWGDSSSSATNSSASSETGEDSSYPQLPYLSYVQNKTRSFWKRVGDQMNELKIFHYTKWNTTVSANSSSFESQLVDLFVSKHLRGEVTTEEEPGTATITRSGRSHSLCLSVSFSVSLSTSFFILC